MQPSLGLDLTNIGRTARRLLKLGGGDPIDDHYLNGPAARCIVGAAHLPGPDDQFMTTEEGCRLISPQLLSLLLLSWSELPVDHPGQRLWRPSGAAPFTTMEEFDARAAYMGAFITAKHVSAWCILLGCDADRGSMRCCTNGHALQVAVVDIVVRP